MGDHLQGFFERRLIWATMLICIPAAPLLMTVALLSGMSLPSATALYLAVCLAPTGLALGMLVMAWARAQLEQRHHVMARHRALYAGAPIWSRAK